MALLRRQSLVKFDAPLCETIVDTPKPDGAEVLVRIERCGLCHSDLHIQDGYADLGGGKKLDTTRGMVLPFTLGHEIAGVVEEAGPDAPKDLIGALSFSRFQEHVVQLGWLSPPFLESKSRTQNNT